MNTWERTLEEEHQESRKQPAAITESVALYIVVGRRVVVAGVVIDHSLWVSDYKMLILWCIVKLI